MPSAALPSRAISALHSRCCAGAAAPRPQGRADESPGRRGHQPRGLGPPVGYGAQADGISSGGGLGSHRHWPLLSLSMPASTFSWCANSSGSATVSTGLLELNRYPLQLYSIHVSHFQAQALQPTPPRTHAALPNGSRALRDLARVGQRGSVRRPGRPPHPQALRAQSVCQVS